MNCDQFEIAVNEVLDQRLAPGEDPDLLQHASECPACEELLQIYSAMSDFAPVELEPIHSFAESKASVKQPRPQNGRLIAGTCVSAALVLMLLALPIGNLMDARNPAVNVARANTESSNADTSNVTTAPISADKNTAPPFTFVDRNGILNELPFDVAIRDDLRQMERSFTNVWKTIQEDEYLIPIIRQGALFWMQ